MYLRIFRKQEHTKFKSSAWKEIMKMKAEANTFGMKRTLPRLCKTKNGLRKTSKSGKIEPNKRRLRKTQQRVLKQLRGY